MKEQARRFALQNAVAHGGQANPKAVVGRLLGADASLRARSAEVAVAVDEVVRAVNAMAPEEQRAELERTAPELLETRKVEAPGGLPELPNVSGPVVMRMAPYPSGPLHIGNARMVLLNDEYVRRYGGKLLLVYDDTIGSAEKFILPEAYAQIREGLDWLGVHIDEVLYKSDRLPLFYEWGERILAAGGAYVCECPSERLRALRNEKTACEHRAREPAENIERFRGMIGGDYAEGTAVVRIKTDIAHPNPAFRDRVLFRIADREHPRIGRKYRVWPLLEFSWAVDDHLLGITHVVRGKDLVMEDLMETAIWDALGVQRRPEFVHHGLLSLKDVELSKTEFRKMRERGEVDRIDDPRLWTLQSLARRGIAPEALRSFVKGFSLSLTDIQVPAETLYSENRKIIDRAANRYQFVHNPFAIVLDGVSDFPDLKLPLHPEDHDPSHTRATSTSRVVNVSGEVAGYQGKEVRLKDWINVKVHEGESKATFTSGEPSHLAKIQWVAQVEQVRVKVLMPDGKVESGYTQRAIRMEKPGATVQFEQFGFVRLESVGEEIQAVFAHH